MKPPRKYEGKNKLDNALIYERAVDRINDLIVLNNKARKKEEARALKTGEEPDKSFGIVGYFLSNAKAEAKKVCDTYWKSVEKTAAFDQQNVENLCNAVVKLAALDYEQAICRGGESGNTTMREIERFSKNGDSDTFSAVDFDSVIARIQKGYVKFNEIVKTKGPDIIAETRRMRSKGNDEFTSASIKCPVCGRGLFHYGEPHGRTYHIKCSGCNMEGWYKSV